MIVNIEYIDGTPDELHEDVTETVSGEKFMRLMHEDKSETYVNLDAIRTFAVLGR